MPERESDLTPISEVLGANRMRYGWPPDPLAPGVVMVPRRHQKRDPNTQEPAGTEVFLVPAIEDSRRYYAHLSLRNYREEDERFCVSCKGAGVVRHADLVPGQPGFGMTLTCPRWDAETKRCEPLA